MSTYSDAKAEMEWVIATISAIRAMRTDINIPVTARIPIFYIDAEPKIIKWLTNNAEHFKRMVRVDRIEETTTIPTGSVQIIVEGITLVIPLEGVIDLNHEKLRLSKEIARLNKEINGLWFQLENPQFILKAKPEIIENRQERITTYIQTRNRLQDAHDRLP